MGRNKRKKGRGRKVKPKRPNIRARHLEKFEYSETREDIRKVVDRPIDKTFLIVCAGETEAAYFEGLCDKFVLKDKHNEIINVSIPLSSAIIRKGEPVNFIITSEQTGKQEQFLCLEIAWKGRKSQAIWYLDFLENE